MDYTEEFHCLRVRNNLLETEHQQISRIVKGLREDIKKMVNLYPLAYLSDAITLATKLEE